MMIKILKVGKGGGRTAVVYLLREHDHKGSRRAEIRVLRGDPVLVGHLIDSLKFKHRYSSIVIAWHRGDAPSQAQIDFVLDGFEMVCRSGLRRRSLGWCAVLHVDDKGAKHVHVLIARVDLRTRKSFNIAPPGWRRTFDHFCNALNFRYGWARPDVPSAISIPEREVGGESNEDLADKLHRIALSRIRKGLVSNRSQLLRMVERFGSVTWEGHRHLKIVPHGSEETVTLKGAMFGKHFDFRTVPVSMDGDISDFDVSRSIDFDKSAVSYANLKNNVSRRYRYNSMRYGIIQDKQQLSEELSGWQQALWEDIPLVPQPPDCAAELPVDRLSPPSVQSTEIPELSNDSSDPDQFSGF